MSDGGTGEGGGGGGGGRRRRRRRRRAPDGGEASGDEAREELAPERDAAPERDSAPALPLPPEDSGPAPAITLAPDLPADPPDDEPDPSTADLPDAAEPERFADLVAVAGVRLTSAGRIYWCDAHDLVLAPGDRVIVEGEKGPRLAVVAIPPVRRAARDRHLRRVTRRATPNDLRAETDAITAGATLLRQAKERVKAMGVPAKVFRVERHGAPRGGRVLVYYTSDDRVELRELVREMGAATGARVELRQLGVRDEAKIVGGIGSCGLELCCTTWLPEFVPVSIKMAKDQGMVLTPTKVSGQCGRLKCCLVYEQATYAEARKGLPKLGKRVITARGEGRVVEVDVLRGRVRVGYGPGDTEVLPGAEVRPMFPSGPSSAQRAAVEPEELSDPALTIPEMPTDDPSASPVDPTDGDDLD